MPLAGTHRSPSAAQLLMLNGVGNECAVIPHCSASTVGFAWTKCGKYMETRCVIGKWLYKSGIFHMISLL